MKKLFILLTAGFFFVSCANKESSGTETYEEEVEASLIVENVVIGNLAYNLYDDKTAELISINDYNSQSGEIKLPSTIEYNSENYRVTKVGYYTLINWTSLTSPLYNDYVFAHMPSSYKGAYVIPQGTKKIADGAFEYCSNLTSVTIPNSVTNIGNDAFAYCPNLTSVKIPNSVRSIGARAFYYCDLTSVTIPNSVTSVGESAFGNNTSISSPVYNNHVFVYMPKSYEGEYAIPKGIKHIAGGAFAGCYGLTSITIPDGVTCIPDHAFDYCNNLTSVSIPNSVTSIGNFAFEYCRSLKSITIPNSVTSIGDGAFVDCQSLKSIRIPNSVTSIGDHIVGYGYTSTKIYYEE